MKVSKEKLVLHLPFDEKIGSRVAYNYAPNRSTSNDAQLSNDCEITDDSVFGNALKMLNGCAECYIGADIVNVEDEFTICAYVRTTSSKLIFSQNYVAGVSQLCSVSFIPNTWVYVAIQRVLSNGKYYTRYIVDREIIYNKEALDIPIGVSIEDDSADTSEITIDDLRVYQRALSLQEIFTLQRENDDVEYYVNGINFKTFGVEVSKSDGLIDALERKDPLRVEWDSYHGEVIDLSRPHWRQREITLECFIIAKNNTDFVRSVNRFIAEFSKSGTQRFTCEYAGTVKPLEYDVYRNDKIEISKNWNDELMVGTFALSLVEPQPVKMVLKHISEEKNSVAWIKCKSNKMLTITWGDNDNSCTINDTENKTKSSGLRGLPIKISHRYTENGEFNIVVHGNIESVTEIETNCIILYGFDGCI